MKINKIQKSLIFVIIATGACAVGCELIVDFDRTKIPVEVSEVSVSDATLEASSSDAGAETSVTGDADATTDADADAADSGG
jgi:hypothetical protein